MDSAADTGIGRLNTELEEGRGPDGGHEGPLRIRRLVYSDLPTVLAIERRSFPTPWSLAMFVLELSKPSGICLAAEVRGDLAGYLVCSRYADVWHLMNVAVTPERRREGIARALIEAMLGQVGSGARLTLEVRASNRVAIAMYERFGFRLSGTRRRYYHDNGEDALIMWLQPPPPGDVPASTAAPAAPPLP